MKEAARGNRQSARNLMRHRQWPNRTIAYCLFSLFFNASLAQAQPIEAADDGIGTQITPEGNSFNITGGSTSKDGANLFHSFSQFGLSAGEIANFQSNPAVVNILSRVIGSNPSYVNGLIQVTGGNSNLFLMNPAGMVFGPNASLNVPASFIATTANGIGFGSLWFNAAEVSDYAALIGTPSAFAFTMAQPAAIINFGNLAVEPGQNIALLAGSIISSGTLSAPGGQITLVAVPGESVVRISQPGHLLSLDVPPQPSAFPIPSLPELLTGSSGSHATSLTVNPDGTVQLTGSGFRVENGDIVAQNLTAGTATLAANRNLTLVESPLKTSGDLRLLARDTVQIRDSLNNPFIAHAGGNLYIQGNGAIDIFALNHPETPFQSGGNLTLVSDGIISGDAHFSSAGTFSILNSLGGGGNFISLYDPIISSEGDVVFGDYVGASLKIEAKGSIIGGNITITSPDTAIVGSDPDIPILTSQPALILRAGVDKLQNPPNVPPDIGTAGNELYSNDFEGPIGDEWSNNKTETTPEGSRNFLGQFSNDTVSLSLENLPTHTGATVSFDLFIIRSWDGNSTDWTPDIWDLSVADGRTLLRTTFGNYNPSFDDYVISQSYPSGYNSSSPIDNESRLGASENNSLGYSYREQTIDSVYNLSFTFPHANSSLGLKFSASNLQVISDESWGLDNVRLSLMENYFTSPGGPSGGSIQVGNISTAGGPVILDARSHIQTGSITSNGGFIDLTSKTGNIHTTSLLDTTAITGNSGNITLNAPGNITTSSMSAGASNGKGGDISINTTAGTITNTATIDSSATNGNAGNITLTALSDIFTANITAKASEGAGGNISITSSAGIIKTTAGTIDSSATNGNAGKITLTALSDIFIGNILTETTYGLSGDIYINSEAGNIITGELLSRTKDNLPGNGGNITLKAKGDIDTNVIFSYTGEGNGGNVSLTSLFSDIDTAGVVAGTGEGNGGAITLNAKKNITAGGLISGAVTGQGGNIKLETSSGNITLTESLLNNYFGKPENIEKLQGTHQFGSDGSITFTPTNTTTLEGEQGSFGTVTFVGPTNLTINVPAPESTPTPTPVPASAPQPTPTPTPVPASAPQPTPIPVQVPTDTPTSSAPATPASSPPPSPDQSKISVSPNGIVSGSVKGNAGSIIINGINVHTGDIVTPSLEEGNGGNISATTGANLKTGNLNTSATQGNAGNVDLTAQNDITIIQINTGSQQGNAGNVSATTPVGKIKIDDIDASTQAGNGGDVILKAQGDITTNQIDTSSQKKNAGNIFLTSLAGNVNTSNLLANSERGKDGKISLIYSGELKTGERHSDKILEIDRSLLLNPFSTDVNGHGGNPKASEEINQTATNPPINLPDTRSKAEEAFGRTPQRNEPSISPSAVSRSELSSTLAQGNIEEGVLQIEEVWTQEFSDSLKEKIPEVMSFSSIRQMLGTIENKIGIKPGVIYAVSLPDQLQLILVTPGNKPIIKSIPEANREKLRDLVKQFSYEINDIKQNRLAASQELYKWLMTPLENELKTQGINSLMFSLDAGLRTIPLAALHDGKEFLIEKYSISLIPSVSYTDVSYKGIQNSQVLAMGRSEFSDPLQKALPAVPIELLIAVKDRLQSKFLLNEAFTLENLKTQRRQQPFGIIHLATHADFQSNSEQAASTYVQLWDRKLQLEEMRQVKWYAQPTVELLVLSACRTAIGDEKAEMGFAGLAVQAGVKSALASLWKVNDVATLALMSEFYRHLGSAPIKAEALRQAQLAMLHERAIVKDSQLRNFSSGIEIVLPAELGHWNEQKLSHPYYWAGFTIIGSPW